MSTKAIRKALQIAVERRGFGDTEEEMKAVDDAEAELEAIERAANVLDASWHGASLSKEKVANAAKVIQSIAKGAK